MYASDAYMVLLPKHWVIQFPVPFHLQRWPQESLQHQGAKAQLFTADLLVPEAANSSLRSLQ